MKKSVNKTRNTQAEGAKDDFRKAKSRKVSLRFSISNGEENPSDSMEVDLLFERYITALNEFVNSMIMLQRYSQLILDVAKRKSFVEKEAMFALFSEVIRDAKIRKGNPVAMLNLEVSKDGDAGSSKMNFGIYDIDLADRIIKFRETYNKTEQMLRGDFIQSLVNIWERLVGALLKARFLDDPRSLDVGLKMSVTDILNCSTYEDILHSLSEKAVKECLMGDVDDQLGGLKKLLCADCASIVSKDILRRIRELFLRRNLFVHCGGVVTNEFLTKEKAFHGDGFKLGETVVLTDEYINNAWDSMYALGVVLVHLVAQNYAKKKKLDEKEDEITFALSNAACEAIVSKRCYPAIEMLTYALKRSVKSMSCQLALNINLGLSYKLAGNRTEFARVLRWLDRASCSNEYKACILALKDDDKSLCSLLRIIAKEKPGFIADIYSWPVFDALRMQECFRQEIQKVWPDCRHIEQRSKFSRAICSCDEILPQSRLSPSECKNRMEVKSSRSINRKEG